MIARLTFALNMGWLAAREAWKCWPYQQRVAAEMFRRAAVQDIEERVLEEDKTWLN